MYPIVFLSLYMFLKEIDLLSHGDSTTTLSILNNVTSFCALLNLITTDETKGVTAGKMRYFKFITRHIFSYMRAIVYWTYYLDQNASTWVLTSSGGHWTGTTRQGNMQTTHYISFHWFGKENVKVVLNAVDFSLLFLWAGVYMWWIFDVTK